MMRPMHAGARAGKEHHRIRLLILLLILLCIIGVRDLAGQRGPGSAEIRAAADTARQLRYLNGPVGTLVFIY